MSKILFLSLNAIRQSKSGSSIILNPRDQELIPGVIDIISKYSDWDITGITNQVGIQGRKKTLSSCIQEQIYTMELLPSLSSVNFCTTFDGSTAYRCHRDTAWVELPFGRNYRKPAPGMIHQFIEDYTSLPLTHALMVGVNRDDQQCALSAGIDFIWADEWR